MHYLRFLWKAQGRHGTHSPFVYQFVEKVLRKHSSFKLDEAQQLYAKTHKIPQNILKCFDYLRESPIAIYSKKYQNWENILYALFPEKKVVAFNDIIESRISMFPKIIYLETTKYFTSSEINNLINQIENGTYIIIQDIHADKQSFHDFEIMRQSQAVQLSLDCWYFGVLVIDLAFKNKQHFYLR